MLRKLVDEYLQQKVTVTLFDDEKLTGYFHSTNESTFENIPEISLKHDCYLLIDESGRHVENLIFKVSHIKNIVQF